MANTDRADVLGETTSTEPRTKLTGVELMLRTLAAQASFTEDVSGEVFLEKLLGSMLNAETEAELFDAQTGGVVSGKDIAGRPFRVKYSDVTVRRSTIEDSGGLPFYYMFTATFLDTGEETMVNCGGRTLVPCLYRLIMLGGLDEETYPDGRPLVIQTHPTASGAYLTLHPYLVKPSGKK